MADRPNLIYVFADQLRYASVGYNGDKLAHTPNIDSLAAQCTVLDNAISGHPVCAPYRASLFTGKYTTSTGMVINEIRINPRHDTIAKVLTREGYETCYIGKWHLYAAQLGNHYDAKNSYIPRGEDRLGFDDYFAGYNFHHQYYRPHAYYHEDSPDKIYVDGYEPDAQVDMAIANMERLQNSDKPWALFLSIGTPHDPWNADNVPPEYYELFRNVEFPKAPNYLPHNDRYADLWARFLPGERGKLQEWQRAYYAMVANLDYNVGRLRDYIKSAGLDTNSIIVFTSDHGEMFGAHGRRAKNIFYDEAVRVPFIMSAPEIPRGKNDTVLNAVDIMPTLLSLLNLPIPQEVEGEDKARFLTGSQQEDEDVGALMMCTGPTAKWGNGKEWRGLRTKRYTYAIYRKDRHEFLFDNVKDPYQMTNLAYDNNYSTLKAQLKEQMFARMHKIGDTFAKNTYYKKTMVKDRKII